jgi:tetratricopeptide (TPR) repeat protein
MALSVGAVVLIKRNYFAEWSYAPSRSGPASADEKKVFAEYGGSASCKKCHRAIYATWKDSNHGLAERQPIPAMDERAFNPPRTFQYGSQETSVSQTNGRYEIRTLGSSNTYEQFPVERVIGNDPLRQFLVKFPGGRFQATEAAYDPHRNEWFNVYGSEDRKPGEWGHWTGRGMNWNSMCASCHNTRLRKNYDEASDSYRTTMAESTVSCESCHGPLKAHNEWQKQFGKSGKKDPSVAKFNPQQTLENCAYCHSRRGELTGDFKPGDHYLDHARLTIVDATDTFYPDGQVHDEDYEFTAFLGSKMHMRGVTCMDCHNPHSAKTNLPGNALCMRCHNGSYANSPIIDPVSHSHHKVFGYDANGASLAIDLTSYKPKEIKETGGECVNCHMPQTAYMQRHWRHDHGFTIPDPLLTKELGVPNACNRCHQDKDADWAQKQCEKWYGDKMGRPSRQRAQIIAAAREGQSKAEDGLLKLFTAEQNSYWRAVAAGLLQPWADKASVSAALQNGLFDTDALVRAECIRALEPAVEANSSGTSDAIRKRLEDQFRSVRIAAAWALRASIDPASKAGGELLHSLEINADQPIGQMQLGAFAIARNDSQRALTNYEKAIQWDPNSAPIRNDYAVVLASLNRSEDAVTQLEKACELEPRNAEYRYRLALGWNERGDIGKTIESLQLAVQLDPRFARAWYNLGLAFNSAGQSEEGLAALRHAESLSPDDPRIPYARATILARLGRFDPARQAAERALQIRPDYKPAAELLRSLQN